ncbi:hypothetical protein IEQ34_006616 [Dendrobium chrysotoxum]|uniref:DUF4283 domain-containing protein n=1 Tax=Dendrobium chrysotoxum TaxID=161865 RepID=A0AAV7GPM8_DENCH|nr:hypothetical protein IEQ34_006616 [Dendrobium chrysotoxum]
MRLLKWTTFFGIREESPIVPIWISFPNPRLHFFIHEFYMHLVLFSIDQTTAPKTRPFVATVLVEVDITKKHAKKIWHSKAATWLKRWAQSLVFLRQIPHTFGGGSSPDMH